MGGDDRSYVPPPLPTPEKNNTMTFVLIGLGLVAVSGVAYFILKKK
jgi:LPXTG-motif cell wall-anchored protein